MNSASYSCKHLNWGGLPSVKRCAALLLAALDLFEASSVT